MLSKVVYISYQDGRPTFIELKKKRNDIYVKIHVISMLNLFWHIRVNVSVFQNGREAVQ